MIRVSIMDSHAVVRRGVTQILSEVSDMTLVGESDGSLEITELLRGSPSDVLVLDLPLAGRGGFQTLQDHVRDFPQVRFLMFSRHTERHFAVRALRAGAAGYLLKASEPADLIDAIRKVHGGKRYVSPGIADAVGPGNGEHEDSPLHAELTSREFQVFLMLATGASTRGIADELSLSIKTVYNHRERILKKLHLRTNLELIRYAVQHKFDE
jgi:DNA-binding NarL/FixJ family response regulator